MLILSLPTLLGGLAFHFLPESPKFLMSRGKNQKALEIFQNIHQSNHHSQESQPYPVVGLANEKYVTHTHHSQSSKVEAQTNGTQGTAHKPSMWKGFKNGITQMAMIFEGPYLSKCVLIFTIQFGFLWSQNTLRLWLPSILAMVATYEDSTGAAVFDLCTVIESSTGAESTMSSWNSTAMVCSQVRCC